MNYKENILQTIGQTPLVRSISNKNIYFKIEGFNPGGSVKDRIAYKMITKAYEEGLINKETIIIEPTSGNTGIGLAMVCAVLKNQLILTMPESMSIERRKTLEFYGAKIILTKAKDGMQGSVDKAVSLAKETKNSFIPSQFENILCPLAHYETTALEIYEALDGKIDAFVCGIGTGGTISGCGRFLREKKSECLIIGVEPKSSPLINKGYSGSHSIQGIGANFIPKNYDAKYVDNVLDISDEDAFVYAQKLGLEEGIFAGISSGAAYKGATEISLKYPDKVIVCLLPDTASKYLSTKLFEDKSH